LSTLIFAYISRPQCSCKISTFSTNNVLIFFCWNFVRYFLNYINMRSCRLCLIVEIKNRLLASLIFQLLRLQHVVTDLADRVSKVIWWKKKSIMFINTAFILYKLNSCENLWHAKIIYSIGNKNSLCSC